MQLLKWIPSFSSWVESFILLALMGIEVRVAARLINPWELPDVLTRSPRFFLFLAFLAISAPFLTIAILHYLVSRFSKMQKNAILLSLWEGLIAWMITWFSVFSIVVILAALFPIASKSEILNSPEMKTGSTVFWLVFCAYLYQLKRYCEKPVNLSNQETSFIDNDGSSRKT